MVEVPAGFVAGHVGALGAGDAEMASDVFQTEAFQLAGGDIVVLGEDPGVDDMAAEDFVFAIGDRPLGHLHARGVAAQTRAVAAEVKRDFVALGAGLDVFQIEAEKIVALDDVGVALLDFFYQLAQHLRFAELFARDQPLPAGGVGQGDGGDAVALPRRIGKIETALAIGLDVELQALQVAKDHAEKMGPAGEQKKLLQWIAEIPVGCVAGGRCLTGLFLQIGLGVVELFQVGE